MGPRRRIDSRLALVRERNRQAGEMQRSDRSMNESNEGPLRRSYRALLAASIVLAAVGAPIFMRGAVVFAQSVSGSPTVGAPSHALWGLGVFALSATPIGLAGYTWKRTHGFQEDIDDK
jgi:hypothetical protein